MADFSFVDLFAGIGGFHIALESVGGHCVGFSEIAKDAIETYCKNFNEPIGNNLGDITKLKTLPSHDFMTAGVPCQSWSIAGKKLGFDDDRGQLWNDTLFLLNKVRPKVFIFENVKGLADPRNKKALDYIMYRIKEAGYYARKYLLNAYDYGVPQTRVRIYIVGFKDKNYLDRFFVPTPQPGLVQLSDVLDDCYVEKNLNEVINKSRWSLSCNSQGFNDYFLFNDLRNGGTTVHSWDIEKTTRRQQEICYILLGNRRKSKYGILDGNAMSLEHFQEIDPSIRYEELEELVNIRILKHSPYYYDVCDNDVTLTEAEEFLLSFSENNRIMVDKLKINKEFRKRKIKIMDTLKQLEEKEVVRCSEIRYDFKNTKISTGLNGINRIFLPSSKIYPTLVASDTNDYVSTEMIEASSIEEWKKKFMENVFHSNKYRKITKAEACRIQGFPHDFLLPESRPRWMHLIGNSVAVPVIKMLAESVVKTGVFGDEDWNGYIPTHEEISIGQMDKREEPQQLAFAF
ncbi:MAG: DNA (cytosine-5-)-methyltransferase [Bacteroides sp.]|nr:DNA (cytosine-5-)-methyltransferase [Roseburia sp.]MCM1346099.1 DNA (cytosine-5-)-methyltransferase [Bacteroides sp.]MCM1422009.1 DNA (cytosine-5-)-methyltransferase [Bacteroides sp.]